VQHAVVEARARLLGRSEILAHQQAPEERIGAVEDRPGHAGRHGEDLGEPADALVGRDAQESQRLDPLVHRAWRRGIA